MVMKKIKEKLDEKGKRKRKVKSRRDCTKQKW